MINGNFLYLLRDSPPAHCLILPRADLGVDGFPLFLLSDPVVGEPMKLLLKEVDPEFVR